MKTTRGVKSHPLTDNTKKMSRTKLISITIIYGFAIIFISLYIRSYLILDDLFNIVSGSVFAIMLIYCVLWILRRDTKAKVVGFVGGAQIYESTHAHVKSILMELIGVLLLLLLLAMVYVMGEV